jgi:hypothetical protein
MQEDEEEGDLLSFFLDYKFAAACAAIMLSLYFPSPYTTANM